MPTSDWHAFRYVGAMAARKNSLVANINRRKRSGTSRPPARSTISESAYEAMQRGWPNKTRKKPAKKAKAA
jgi:hypothetical protein